MMLKVFELPQTWYATTVRCCCGWGGLTYSRLLGQQVGVLPSVLHVATVVRRCRLYFAFLPQQQMACSNAWHGKRPSYQLALVSALSRRISTLLAWCCTRYYTLPRLAGMWPAVVSPRHCHVHGGRRGHYGGTCAETPSKTRPALLYTVYRAIVVASMCCCCSSCMHECRIVLSIILSCSMCRGIAVHALTHVHACTQQSPFAAIDVHCCCRPLRQILRGLQSPAGAGSGSVALNDLPRLPSLPAYAKTGLLALRLPYCASCACFPFR